MYFFFIYLAAKFKKKKIPTVSDDIGFLAKTRNIMWFIIANDQILGKKHNS